MSSSPPVSRRQVWLLLVKTFSIGALGYYLFWLVNSTKTDDSFISARTLSPERWMALEWARQEGHKILMGYTDNYDDWRNIVGTNFSDCMYTNCVVESFDHDVVKYADILIFMDRFFQKFPQVSSEIRQRQYWVVTTAESSAYSHNRWQSSYDNKFNITATHRPSSILPSGGVSDGWLLQAKSPLSAPIDYATNKTRGAVAYISNCNSVGYDRLRLIEALRRFIPVDLFGGCGVPPACHDEICEKKLHHQYRFYLSFENSLCDGYISEKFWSRLSEDSYFIPIAMGGLSVDDYLRYAPPNSFLHVYNFTSINSLGKYLNRLMSHNELYNSFHKWRETYELKSVGRPNRCELCRLANEKPFLPALPAASAWWNDPKACRSYNLLGTNSQ